MSKEGSGSPEPGKLPPCPPRERGERLPWSEPKPSDEEPEATERVRAIMAHPSYRRADQDIEFLNRNELRPARLELEYLKTELQLSRAGVRGTIVVFGGTRIAEPHGARRAVARARQALELRPGDPELQRRLAVAERILAKSHYYEVARDLGRLIGRACGGPQDSSLLVVTGGGPGLMEAANRGAHDMGASSIGLNIELPQEQYPNPYVTPGLTFRFRYFALRKIHFLLRARALVAFPGGYGTLDELFETLCLIQTRKIEPLPVVLVGESYWRRAFDADFLVAEGVIDLEDLDLFWFAESAEEIWSGICRWYERVGLPLVP